MKKIFFGMFGIILFMGTTSALSCAGPAPSYEEVYDESEIVFQGILEDIEYVPSSYDTEFCESQGGNATPGMYTFTFSVTKEFKGQSEAIETITREVSPINCTWGGGCTDLDINGEYVIMTTADREITGGLCSKCGFQKAEDFFLNKETSDVCICPMVYAPVCGVDGVTYGNSCALECAGVELQTAGECIAPVIDNTIPNFCTKWYDGCNSCSVENGIKSICTEKACLVTNRSKCELFQFTILKQNHLDIIDHVINKRSESASETKKDILLEKIEDKLEEVTTILATSTFIQGSKELDSYTMIIEVLWYIKRLF